MLSDNNHIILTIDVEDNFTPEELANPVIGKSTKGKLFRTLIM